MPVGIPTLKNIITQELWRDGFSVLEFQIKQKQVNKHFNTLSMYYYEQNLDKLKALTKEDYYNEYVASNLFYGLREQFWILPYLKSKSRLGLREYKFLSAPLLTLYNSVALYLLRISQEFINDNKHDYLFSFYGGGIYYENDKLILTKNNIFYRNFYKSFRSKVRSFVNDAEDHSYVIKLDIENYFNLISISKLLELLRENLKPTLQDKYGFNQDSISQIESFFQFLMDGKSGIPQHDNNLLSNFLAHLYLTFGDLFIDDLIKTYKPDIWEYKIIRYVDDYYICIEFSSPTDKNHEISIIYSLVSQIVDCFLIRLGLKLNSKSCLFDLSDEEEKENLYDTLHRVSPDIYMSDEENKEKPFGKANAIIEELEKLQLNYSDIAFSKNEKLRDEIFKEIFDKNVFALLDRKDYVDAISKVFLDFNFDLIKASPLEIILVILKSASAKLGLENYLCDKDHLTTSDIELILHLLCQTGFTNTELKRKLKENQYLQHIFTKIETGYQNSLGYYDLGTSETLKISTLPVVIEQIRLKVLSERNSSYSVALNHLLNEIHAISWEMSISKPKDFDAQDVLRFLESKNLSNEICIQIANLFDRRNNNQVSHPGNSYSIPWGVTKAEYEKYSTVVGNCLEKILL